MDIHMAFEDFNKAFDSLEHKFIWDTVNLTDLLKELQTQIMAMASVADRNALYRGRSGKFIWEALQEAGVDPKYIRMAQELYRDITGTIKLEQLGKPFFIRKGVRQDNPLMTHKFEA